MIVKAVAVSTLAQVHSGGAAPQDPAAFSSAGHPFVRAGSLPKLLTGSAEDTLEKLDPVVAKMRGLKLFPAGTVIFAKSGMSATSGHVYRLRGPAYVVSHLAALVPRDPGDSAFLMRALQRFSPTVLVKDAAYPSIRLGDIEALVIMAPADPAERRRIGQLLDVADTIRAKRRAAVATLDALTQAIFLDMFGDAGQNEGRWPMRPVSDYVANFQGGKSIEAGAGENADTRNRVLKISAVTGMRYLAQESKPVPDAYEPPAHHFVRSGDLLFSRANTTELVGAVARVDVTPANMLLPDKLWRFVWRQPVVVEPVFVWALFQTPALRREIGRRATGTSGSMKNVSQAKVLGIRTILPPLPRQRDFALRITGMEKLRAAHSASLGGLNALFATLQDRAFRGQL